MQIIDKEQILSFLKEEKANLLSYGVTKLGLFGSYARDENSIFSDIDIVIESDVNIIQKKFSNPLCFFEILDDLKAKIVSKFGTTADICDVTSLKESEKIKFLGKVIYA